MQAFKKLLSTIEDLLAVIAVLFLALLIVSVSYGVIARAVGGLPTAWTVEVSEYSMLYMAMLAAPWILRHNGHVRVDLVTSMLPLRARAVLLFLTNIAATIAVAILFYFSTETTLDYMARNVVLHKSLDIPQWVVLSAIPVGSLFLTLRLAVETVATGQAAFDPEKASSVPEVAATERERVQGE